MRAMSTAPVAALLVLLTLASVLAVSGIAKVRQPLAVEDAFVSLRVPSVVRRRPAARVLPWLELALAVLLLVSPSALLVAVLVVVWALMLTYTALVARALTDESPVECSCFGKLGRHQVDRLTLVRNLLLLLLASAGLWFAVAGGSVPATLPDLGADEWWVLAAAVAAAAVAVLVVGGPSADTKVVGEPLDYERQPIPYGVLTRPGGPSATLTELASTQARLLVVLNTNCGPCDRIAAKLDPWESRLAPAVGILAVYPQAGPDVAHAESLTMVEPELNVRRLFSVGTPSAMLLGADGLMAGGPVAGEGAVAQFVEDIVAELDADVARGDDVDS